MSLAVVNGANILARTAIKTLATMFDNIKLIDYKPYRPAVYALQKEIGSTKAIDKIMYTNTATLSKALEGSEKVLYFTHDYFTLSPDKNQTLQATAKVTRKLGIKNLLCVCPIEFDHYFGEGKTPFKQREEAELKAKELNSDLTLLHTNLLFGEESYFVKFLTQSALSGEMIYPRLKECTKQEYFPVHTADTVNCIVHALNNAEIKGKNFAVRGSSAISYDGIIDILTKHSGVDKLNKKARCPIFGFVEKFIVGETHDKNMMKMIECYESKPQDFKNEDNYFEKFKLVPKYEFNAFYAESKAKEESYMEPHLFKYKTIALD